MRGSGNEASGTAGANEEMAQLFHRMHMVNRMEMEAGKLAAERATNPRVKEYAMMLQRDHQTADERVQQLATQQGITLESGMGHSTGMHSGESGTMHGSGGASQGMMEGHDMHESMQAMERLKTMRGREFDLAFMQQMVKDHEKVLSMLESFRPRIQDTAIQQETAQLMTSIRAHRDAAQTIVAALPGASDRKDVRGNEPNNKGGSPSPTPQR
jgi:putative membrane protein